MRRHDAPSIAHGRRRTFRRENSARSQLHRLLFGAPYMLLVLLFLLGYAAAFLPPVWFWWLGLFAVTVPYSALLLVLVSPLAFWRFGRVGRLAHGFLLLLIGIRFLFPWTFPEKPAASEEQLMVMTFNAPVRGPHPDSLARATLRLIRAHEPDLLALQEPVIWLEGAPLVPRATPHVQAVLDSLPYRAPVPRRRGDRYDVKQPVLSRFALEEIRQITLPANLGAEQPTYITRIHFRWQGREAVLYNLHLHTVGERKPWHDDLWRLLNPHHLRAYLRSYREAYLRRAWEVEQVSALLAAETLPLLVVGDFNSTMHHWEYRQLARGLRDAFTARGRGWGATYHARVPLVRIDHILAGPAWEVVSSYVPEGHAYSDHRPVVARLRWREEVP